MKRFTWSFAFACIVNFGLLAGSTHLSPLELALEKQASHEKIIKIRIHIQEGKWEQVCTDIKTDLSKDKISFHQLEELAKAFPASPFATAIQATKNILAIKQKTALSVRTVLPIALFAETYLQDEVMKGKVYFPESLFGRACEYDPETQRLLIHLPGVKQLGEGMNKIVFRALLYDRTNPRVVAHAITKHNVKNEMEAMRALRGVPGVIQAEALLLHKEHKSQTVSGIVTPIYNQGSLYSVLQNSGSSLSFTERLSIAKNLITGLASMHEHGYVHRDLGVKNHFINFEQKGHKRKITAVIADLGRTLHISKAKHTSVQGNTFYFSPEGFYPEKLKGKDYLASDVFALGCVFWQLYFNKLPAWSAPRFVRREGWPMSKRYHAHLSLLKKTRKPYVDYLREKKSHKTSMNVHDKFLAIILKMTRPDPKARGTAASLKEELMKVSG